MNKTAGCAFTVLKSDASLQSVFRFYVTKTFSGFSQSNCYQH